EAAAVQELLTYPEGTAGRLMTRRFAAVAPRTPAAVALEYLRRASPELETVNIIYVVNGRERLAGVCSIRELLTAAPEQPMSAVMVSEPITVRPDTDQQEI